MAVSIDQQFIEYIVKSIVNQPDAVSIKRTIDEKGVLLELTVDQEDLGRVIGKRGATAQSLRTLLRALGTKNDARYNLKIVDVGEPPQKRQPRDDRPASVNDDKPADDSSSDNVQTKSTDDDIVEEEQVEEIVAKDEPSDVVSRTRAELADLDDLDV